MQSSFFSIETMRRALLAHKKTTDVIGHNIANANTEGYSRQEVRLKTTEPLSYPGWNRVPLPGQMGTGVQVAEIFRIRDVYLDKQYRIGNSSEGKTAVERSTLREVENAFLEPGSAIGFNESMTGFFDAWQELSKRPDNVAVRQNVISTAQQLVDTIHSVDQTLRDIRVNLDQQISEDVRLANTLIDQIAQLNHVISQSFAVGDQPNDLMDQRDRYIDDLSNLVDISVIEDRANMARVLSGSRLLVDEDRAYPLTNEIAIDHPSQATQTPMFRDVSSEDYDMLLNMAGGELRGLLNSRDVLVREAQDTFTEVVQSLVNEVNAAHVKGFGQILPSMLAEQTMSQIDLPVIGGGGQMYGSVQLNAQSTNLSVGDIIKIEDADGNYIVTQVQGFTTTAIANDTIQFASPIESKTKPFASGPGLYQGTGFTIGPGASVQRIDEEKRLFFTSDEMLTPSYSGDHRPAIVSRMTSAVLLPQEVNFNTTVEDLRALFGRNAAAGPTSLTLDNQGAYVQYTDNTTIGQLIQRFNQAGTTAGEGAAIQMEFDLQNRRIVLTGEGGASLSQLGGHEGSDGDLFRILGFEGYGLVGHKMLEGTNLSMTLADLGISDGWFQIDGVDFAITNTGVTLQNFFDSVNQTLSMAGIPSKTNIIFDETAGRTRVTGDHIFTARQTNTFPSTPPSSKSNFLDVLGLQRVDSFTETASLQNLASVVSSDVGARVRLNSLLENNVNLIAAATSQTGIPGDGSVALDVAQVETGFYMNDIRGGGDLSEPTQSINEYYAALIGQVGTASQRAISENDVATRFVEFYANRREEVSGVSIDEELTKMIASQHAFNAAGRMITTIDQMLDRIINGMGLVGR